MSYDDLGADISFATLLDATLIESSTDEYFIQLGWGDFRTVPRNTRTELAFETDIFDDDIEAVELVGRAFFSSGDGMTVTARLDLDGATSIIASGDERTLDDDELEMVLNIFQDTIHGDDDPGTVSSGVLTVPIEEYQAETLYHTYRDIIKRRVDDDTLAPFRSYYGDCVEVTDDGWIVDDTFLVTYEAENYLLGESAQFEVDGRVVQHSGPRKQALGLNFDVPKLSIVDMPRRPSLVDEGTTICSARELEFLATVEILLDPDSYLNVDGFEAQAKMAVQRAKTVTPVAKTIADIAHDAEVSHFVDPVTGLIHTHELSKHTLQASFGVRQWVVDELVFSSFDHGGCRELAWREDEFREAERNVFFNTENEDESRWDEIHSKAKSALVGDDVLRELRARYGPPSR